MKKLFYLLGIVAFFTIQSLSAQNMALDFTNPDPNINPNYARTASTLGLGTTNVTAECWVNIPTTSVKGTFIQVGNSDGVAAGYSIGVGNADFDNAGNELIMLFENKRWIPTGVNIGMGWHHIVFSLNNNGYPSVYLDGVLVHTDAIGAPGTPTGVTTIASTYPNQGRTLTDGTIDEVRFWNDVRTPAELRVNMYKELTGSEANLAAYLKLNETSGTTANDSKTGGSNHFTITNSPAKIPSSAFFGPKNCLSFDGTNDFVEIGDLNETSSGTIEMWFLPNVTSSSYNPLFGNGTSGNIIMSLGVNTDDRLTFSAHDGTWKSSTSGEGSISTSKWNHVAATWEQNNYLNIYINGVLAGSTSFGTLASTSANAFIGTSILSGADYFDGKIDEVRIWNDVRTVAEIRENMNKTLIGDEANLAAYYNFDNSGGTVLQDFSGNGTDGTCFGYGYSTSGTLENAGPGSYEQYFFDDLDATWTVDALIGMTVSITTSGNVVTDYTVGSNTATQITKTDWNVSPFTPALVSGDAYTITENNPDADWTSSSAFNTWLNTASTDWTANANWSSGAAPSSIDNTGIYNYSGASQPAIPTGQTINNLFIGSSVTAQVGAGENLTVNRNFFNYGSFTVASTGMGTSGTGSLIVGGEAPENITFERYANVYSKGAKWHYVSAPVSGQALNTPWMIANDIGFTDPARQFYRWDEDSNYWIYYGYEGSEPENFSDETFVNARGYCLSRNSDGVLSFSGTPITENVTYAATYTAGQGTGFNLVGNPFTSAIGVTTAAGAGNFLAANTDLLDDSYEALYIWDEATGYTFGSQDYRVINNAAVTGSAIDQDFIAPGQAFMVKVASAGNLAFNTNMQAHSTAAAYKSKEVWPSVELTITGNGNSNSTGIGFNPGMTLGLDPSYDAAKFKGNPNLALYSKLVDDSGKDFAIQALPNQNIEDYIIPIGVDVKESGVFEFSATQESLDNYSLILEDRQENTFTDLRWDTYFATISESGTERFYLHFKDATGIENPASQNNIQIFAADGQIIIKNETGVVETDGRLSLLTVTDIMGRIILQKTISTNEITSIPVNLQAGVYIVSVKSGNGIKAEKVFIK